MAVTYNMKGTSHPSFAIGKSGPRIFNSSSDPSGSETVNNSDLWIDTTNYQIKIRVSGAWKQVGETVETLSASTLAITGDLTVSGTTTSINSTVLDVNDNKITLNSDHTAAPTQDAGIVINRGTATDVELRWNETSDKWEFTEDGSTFYQLGDTKISGLGFDTSTGILTATLSDSSTIQVDLDGRYLTSQTDNQTLSFDSSTNALTISSGNSVTIDSIPTQSGHSGKFLTTDGTDASWGDPGGMPDAGDVWGVITASSDNNIDLGTVAGDASLWHGLDFGELVEKISHSDLSVVTASASGGGSLAYDSSTGVFTFTPPVPGTYTVTESDVTTHQAALSITESQISDLQSYLTSVPAQTFSSLTGKPTTLAGYGITDGFDGAFSSLSSKPTTLAGYGITDALQLGTSATTALAGNTSIPSAVSELSNDSAFITNSITTDFTLTNTDTDSDAGPILKLIRDSASPAVSDRIGRIEFKGDSSTGVERTYAAIEGGIGDPSNTAEDGFLQFIVSADGALNTSNKSTPLTLGDNYVVIDTGAMTVTTSSIMLFDAAGTLTLESNTGVTLDADVTVKGHFIPDINNIYDLGSSSKQFRNTYTGNVIFEGASADAHETNLTVEEPTADRTVTIPDESGTVSLDAGWKKLGSANWTSDTGYVDFDVVDSTKYRQYKVVWWISHRNSSNSGNQWEVTSAVFLTSGGEVTEYDNNATWRNSSNNSETVNNIDWAGDKTQMWLAGNGTTYDSHGEALFTVPNGSSFRAAMRGNSQLIGAPRTGTTAINYLEEIASVAYNQDPTAITGIRIRGWNGTGYTSQAGNVTVFGMEM